MVFVDLAQRFRVGGINRWYDGGVVLEFVEVGVSQAVSVVEWVREGWVEGAERQLVDVVAEVEGCEDVN